VSLWAYLKLAEYAVIWAAFFALLAYTLVARFRKRRR
jgi:hypothetical protein